MYNTPVTKATSSGDRLTGSARLIKNGAVMNLLVKVKEINHTVKSINLKSTKKSLFFPGFLFIYLQILVLTITTVTYNIMHPNYQSWTILQKKRCVCLT